jgi:hypothetical protein
MIESVDDDSRNVFSATVGVEIVRQLGGLFETERPTKVVLVTTAECLSSDARKYAADSGRVELIPFEALNQLLNQYMGTAWPKEISLVLRRTRQNAG